MDKMTRFKSILTIGIVLLFALSLTWIFYTVGAADGAGREAFSAEDIENNSVNINLDWRKPWKK